MHPRIKGWNKSVDENTKLFIDRFNNFSKSELNWKPNTNDWSVAQIIDHLIKTNSSYFRISEIINDKNYKQSVFSKFPFYPKIIGNLILKSVDPDNKRKTKTMKVFTPSYSEIEKKIIMEFIDSQSELLIWIKSNEEQILSREIIPSPVSNKIVYHFDTVIDILVNHQKRHYNQACNIFNSMEENGKI
jgi:hypothetical protein